MPKYINKGQMRRATDEELEQFFEETVFEGIFSYEIKSKNTDFYKGSITDIKIEGRTSSLAPMFLNVPRTSNNIPEGPCSFKCRINIPAFREDPYRYILNVVGSSLRSISEVSSPNIDVSSHETQEQQLFEMWGVDDCQCIGYYHYDAENEIYLVDDLRKPNFDHIPYYPGDKDKKPISITCRDKILGIKLDDYYLFTWKLSHRNSFNPFEIVIDFDKQRPKKIDPKWFIDTLFNDRHNDKSKNFGSAANFLDTLGKQLTANDSTFIYELLQNANDYPVEGFKVDVNFYITDNYLLFLHSGEKFNIRNISGICGINEKEKTANKKTIGYKGIGFKTVFLHNHYVYIRTGKYSFRFDEGEMPEKKMNGKIRRLGAPFQILPIWTEHEEVTPEVNDILDSADKKYQVQIALRPDNKDILHVGRNSYESLFKELFSDSNIILFIPNINSVKVFIDGNEVRTCYRNNDEWIVSDYEEDINFELQELINKTIDKGGSRIPEKYKDFECTKVSFACKHEGALIKPVENATLYCYLPTSASWGLPFLMNTDMIPKGDRNDIEMGVNLLGEDGPNFNQELSGIAGNKFFSWVRDLLTSRKYHLGSVFSLFPDFKQCKREHSEYTEYIERFEAALNECLDYETIVPVHNGISLVKNVILDNTGLSSSGIMSDDEFLRFTGMDEYYLPLSMLRKDKYFVSFLKRYASDEQKFEKEDLRKLIANEDFQDWLCDQDNNNKFMEFLLDRGYLKDLLDEEIFLEAEGSLFCASDLYYDIEKYLVDLRAFESHIAFLSPKTREYFKDNQKWAEVVNGEFAVFDCDNIIDNNLLADKNIDETRKNLTDKDVSYHFYKFLAENVRFSVNYLSLPFINDKGEAVDSFVDRFCFFSSEQGSSTCSSAWLSSLPIDFLSDKYSDETKQYFRDYFGVRDFSDEIIIKEIILSDDFSDTVLTNIGQDFQISKNFVDYCFSHKSVFSNGSLRHYSLKVFDGEGVEQWYFADGDVFFQSSLYDYYSSKEWIDPSWMVSLEGDYYNGGRDADQIKKFLSNVMGVEELTESNFYQNVVKPNITDIIGSVTGSNDPDGIKNFDFVKYLDDNYELIFDEQRDKALFDSFKPVSTTIHDLNLGDNIYVYDEELAEIVGNDWFPDAIVELCNKGYGNSRALVAMGCKSYVFSSFYDDVIVKEIDSINDNIGTLELSVDFHNFIISHLRGLTTEQQEKMTNAKVFLYGGVAADKACGHKTLSVKAKELFDKKLVEFSDLDIIDPLYNTDANVEYWETRLGNTKFTIVHFFAWLENNSDTFSNTIREKQLNIDFWRWLKGNVNITEKIKEDIPVLPILLNNNGEIAYSDEAIYFSDAYLNGKSLETYVKKFDENAQFISSEYISEGDKIESWVQFWTKIGIKQEIIDVIIDTIIPGLDEIEDDSLPSLLSEYRESLEKHFGEDLIPQLSSLRVKGYDGNYYHIQDCIYIDCEKEEPFKYILLPNQISFKTAGERRLIKEIIKECGGVCVSTLSEWQQYKVDQYLSLQNDDEDSIRDIHYEFINDLSIIRNTNSDTLKEIENLREILLLNTENEFCKADTLTMGSIYNPFFDFEGCGINELDYVSNNYNEKSSQYTGRLFRSLGIHCDFNKTDVRFLEQRECSIYFWGTYLIKPETNIDFIIELIENGQFNDLSCIPTKDNMKTPSELYHGKDVAKYVKSIEDWENKIPLKDLPEIKLSDGVSIFDKLPFKESLGFLDALYALINITGQDRRTQLLNWMIETYEEEYDDVISDYREDEHALWYNTKNESVQIKELYALDWWDKSLEQYFGSNNPRIINRNYFPVGDGFKKACDILGVKTISASDLIMVPENDTIFLQRNRDLRLFALVIAGKIGTEGWQERYAGYKEKLDSLVLHRCSSIKISYKEDESINQNLKKFYHEKNSDDFYFVNSLDDKRVYQYFIKAYLVYIGVEEGQIAIELVEDIMDSGQNALDIVKEDNSLMIDEDFKNELEIIIPDIKRELSGNKAVEEIEDTFVYRPSFTTKQNDEEDGEFDDVTENGSDYNDNPYNHQNSQPETRSNNYPNSNNYVEPSSPANYKDRETRERTGGGKSSSSNTTRDIKQNAEIEKPAYNETSGGENVHKASSNKGSIYDYESNRSSHERSNTTSGPLSQGNTRNYADMNGWGDYRRSEPKPFSPEDVRNFGSKGIPRTLEVLEPQAAEIDEINRILGGDLTAEQVADQHYLAQLRLYNNLVERNMTPIESKEDFVRNVQLKKSHTINGGKYIYKCNAAGGIMYLSPFIWNKIADERCVVCVYIGSKSNEFMYFNTIDDILKWVGEDDIVIKLTGVEKAEVVEDLYSGVLRGVSRTAYTLIRVASNERYNSLFAPLSTNVIDEIEENEDEY